MAATNKCLAQSNKSCAEARATKKSYANEPRGNHGLMTPALAAPNPSDSFERERSGHVLRWSRIAPAREELRNASNKNEHEPTSDHSTNYGNGHLIRVFLDIGRIFSWLLSLYLASLGALRHPSPVRHRLQRYCSKLKPKCGFVQKKDGFKRVSWP